jgi:hypothetical protein
MHSYAHGSLIHLLQKSAVIFTLAPVAWQCQLNSAHWSRFQGPQFFHGKILKPLGDLMGSLGFVGTDSIASPIWKKTSIGNHDLTSMCIPNFGQRFLGMVAGFSMLLLGTSSMTLQSKVRSRTCWCWHFPGCGVMSIQNLSGCGRCLQHQPSEVARRNRPGPHLRLFPFIAATFFGPGQVHQVQLADGVPGVGGLFPLMSMAI